MNTLRRDRIAGLRFAYLIRQLIDDGWTAAKIAEAIGCDISLISRCRFRPGGGATSGADVLRKGLRDDVMQGVYDGLGVRVDYLVMPVPKGYPKSIRLKSGDTRPAEYLELDHKDFRVIPHEELEAARARKDREQTRQELGELRAQVAATNDRVASLAAQMERLLAVIGGERGHGS